MPSSEQGINSTKYKVIPRTLIFIVRGDLVLLLRGASSKRLWANCYNGIGGHIEPGENIESAAKRELFEESGLSLVDLHLCGTVIVDTGEAVGVLIFVFKGFSEEGEVQNSDEGFLEWLPFSGVDQLPVVQDLPYLLKKVEVFQPGDAIFFARSFYTSDGLLQIEFND